MKMRRILDNEQKHSLHKGEWKNGHECDIYNFLKYIFIKVSFIVLLHTVWCVLAFSLCGTCVYSAVCEWYCCSIKPSTKPHDGVYEGQNS